jgi:hypothetical protein
MVKALRSRTVDAWPGACGEGRLVDAAESGCFRTAELIGTEKS